MIIAYLVNPLTPLGVAGSSKLVIANLAFVTTLRVKRRISDVKPICLFVFYSNKRAFAGYVKRNYRAN